MSPSGPTPGLGPRIRAALGSHQAERPQLLLTRRLFLALLGFVYLAAFVSAFVQIEGLIGSRGIMPAERLLESLAERVGSTRYWQLPTLLWLDVSDLALRGLCLCGALVSLLPILGIASRLALFAAWALYLSLVSVGSIFFGYQWDALLLECGLLALFFAPRGLGTQAVWTVPVSRAGLWLLRFLLFRLMLLSGLVKIASGDPTWRDGTALAFHYATQPIPTWTSYYAHQLPAALHAASTLATLGIEIGAAFLIFAPRRGRLLGFLLLAGLQALIASTGSYGFFNLLTLALCVTLLDDRALRAALPSSLAAFLPAPAELQSRPGDTPAELQSRSGRSGALRRAVAGSLAGLLIVLSALVTLERVGLALPRPAWVQSLLYYSGPARAINAYGLFAVMTTERPEILLEGSRDGRTWRAYEFHWKPGPLERRPRFAGLHMPRLDWQLWFAALRGCEGAPWFRRLLVELLEGSPSVTGLLRIDPFADAPPRYLRSRLFLYEFEPLSAADDSWWRREFAEPYCATVQLEGGELRRADRRYQLD